MRSVDITGNKYGMLKAVRVVGYSEDKSGRKAREKWLCQCDCGKECVVRKSNLVSFHTTSCGCKNEEEKKNRREDLVGRRFGRLTVVKYIEPQDRTDKHRMWLCKCDCGNMFEARADSLKVGTNLSCGCYRVERYNDGHSKIHGESRSRLYAIWRGMKSRCYNPKNDHYNSYGGRGIKVCDEWINSYENFRDWAYSSGYDNNAKRGEYTIDRIDVDGNYDPLNCRWISMSKQANNKQCSRKFQLGGVKYTVSELAKMLNVTYSFLYHRLVVRSIPLDVVINELSTVVY